MSNQIRTWTVAPARPASPLQLASWTVALALAGPIAAISSAPAAAEFTFDQYEIAIDNAEAQTILTGFLLGGATADIAVLSVDENDDRRLHIYGFGKDTWEPMLDATLGREVLFVDVANIDGRDRLITYQSGRLNWFDPSSETERRLTEVVTNYNATPPGLSYANAQTLGPADEGEVPHIDITRDLNGDGRDDLALPDVDGFWIATQRSDGSFTEPMKLGPAEPFRNQIALGDTRTYGEVGITPLTVPWYLSRLHAFDYDQDGLHDLVFWNEDHFIVHHQETRGTFSPIAETVTVDVPFDSDGAYSLYFGLEDASELALVFGLRKSTQRSVLCSFRDLNGDGVADLMTHTLSGRSLLRQRSRYEVYLGKPTHDGLTFSQEANTVIEPKGKGAGMETSGYSSLWLQDFDGDGQTDLMRGDVQIGVGAMVRALLGTSVSMTAELFRIESGVSPTQAAATRKTKADLAFRGGGGRDAGFFPAVLVGDVNGDGRADVLVGRSRGELYVFLGGPELLAQRAQKVEVNLPGDERNSWLVDLDQDGKQDLLMHHPSVSQPHRLTILMAR